MTELTAQQVVRDIEARMLGLTGANVTTWEMRVLLAERRELLARQVPEWQSIESAPMDGTAILAIWKRDEYKEDGSAKQIGAIFWRGEDWWGDDENLCYPIRSATHWMPLPAPPSPTATDV